ncbi:MAG: PstS family phosphate ABC transporter substrate-binding protein [Oscillatoriaceae cyanobacterium]
MEQKREVSAMILSLLAVGVLVGGGLLSMRQGLAPSVGTRQGETSRDGTRSGEQVRSFAGVTGVPSGVFNYGGSTTWAPVRGLVDPLIQVVWPDFQLRYVQHPTEPPGSGTGIGMLLDDQLTFVQSCRSLTAAEYAQAREKGFVLREIPVAIDSVAVAVNPELDVPGLTVVQLRDIYRGKIRNWQEVGGPDLPIKAYSRRSEDSGTIQFFIEQVLNGEDFGASVELLPSTTLAVRAVAAERGAIYFASAPQLVPQCQVKTLPLGLDSSRLVPPYLGSLVPPQDCPQRRNLLNTAAFERGDYPLTRRLFVVVKQNGQIDETAGLAYGRLLLTAQGQAALAKAGFIPIAPPR